MPKIAVVTVALMLGTTPAFAHVDMTSSVPANGGELAPGSKEIALTFDALIKHATCTLTDASEKAVAALGAPKAEREKVFLPLTSPLEAGSYKIACKVAGPDGHERAHGLSFVVK